MPTYQYLCDSCGHEFERFQSIKAGPLRKCPECSKMQLNRLIGAGGAVIFKGSGFYQTDYPTESNKEGEKNAKPKTETETKTETKTKTKTPDASKAKTATKKTHAKSHKE
ncbi:MAG: zinc ribbon domain-containing protein [Planctomycetota bacterium]|nr:MAG: zinc ribbon domain-containing protein [Planctomycetota bacterium]